MQGFVVGADCFARWDGAIDKVLVITWAYVHAAAESYTNQGSQEYKRRSHTKKVKMASNEFVLGFAFRHDASGTVVLVRKTHPHWQAGKLNGVGGRVEEDEVPMEAMAREFKEETGADIPFNRWIHFASLSTLNGVVHLYAANTWETDKAHTMTDEEVVFVHKDHLPADVMPELRWMIPMAYDALHTQLRYINMVAVG